MTVDREQVRRDAPALLLVTAAIIGGCGGALSEHGQTVFALLCWMLAGTLLFSAGVLVGAGLERRSRD